MSSKPSNSHHFVPRSVLRRFCADANRTHVIVFDKRSGNTWPGDMASTGSAKAYNKLARPSGESVNLEPDFDEIDSYDARIDDELTETQDLSKAGRSDAARLGRRRGRSSSCELRSSARH